MKKTLFTIVTVLLTAFAFAQAPYSQWTHNFETTSFATIQQPNVYMLADFSNNDIYYCVALVANPETCQLQKSGYLVKTIHSDTDMKIELKGIKHFIADSCGNSYVRVIND